MKRNPVQWLPESFYKRMDEVTRLLHGRCSPSFPLFAGHGSSPFFLVSCGRSGNTLLRRMLSVSPQVYIPEETYFLRNIIREGRACRCLDWAGYVDRMISIIMKYTKEMHEISFFENLKCICKNIPEDRRTLSSIVDVFYERSALLSGKQNARWGDKTPMYAYCVAAIKEVFPAAQFIHVLRDGVDVCASCVDAGLMSSYLAAAHRWASSVRRIHAFQKRFPEAVTLLRYEDLVLHPTSTLQELCQFLGVTFQENMVTRLDVVADMGDVNRFAHHSQVRQPLSKASVGKGRRTLSDKTKKQIGRVMNTMLVTYGYPQAEDS